MVEIEIALNVELTSKSRLKSGKIKMKSDY